MRSEGKLRGIYGYLQIVYSARQRIYISIIGINDVEWDLCKIIIGKVNDDDMDFVACQIVNLSNYN